MDAIYISNNSFKVLSDKTSEFISGRRLKLNCGVDGTIYATVITSSLSGSETIVTIKDGNITPNLIDVLYGVVSPGITGSVPEHTHNGDEGSGGQISFASSFLDLTDTPTTYSGSKYLRTTSSGIEFVDIEIDNSVDTFLSLADTPTTYSGLSGKYLKTTSSGIEFVDIDSSSADLTSVNSHILPEMTSASGAVSTRDIGSPTQKFRNAYIHDLFVDAGSLYVNNKKVIEDVSNTITIKTDDGQDLKVKTTGTGDVILQSDNDVNINSKGGIEALVPADNSTKHINFTNQSDGGNITFFSTGNNSQIQFSSQDEIDFTSPIVDINGNVSISGDLLVNGETIYDTSSFIYLSDTPTTYSGMSGKYLKTTASGIEFNNINWGTISGTLSDQTDLQAELTQAKNLIIGYGTPTIDINTSDIIYIDHLSYNFYIRKTDGLSFYDYIISLSPSAFWRLDEEAGATEAIDSSINELSASYINSPSIGVQGILGSEANEGLAIELSASQYQYLQVPHNEVFNEKMFSITLLIKPNDMSNQMCFFQHGNTGVSGQQGYYISVLSTGQLNFASYYSHPWRGVTTTNSYITSGQPYFIGVVVSEYDSIDFYVDGVFAESLSYPYGIGSSTHSAIIGARKNGTSVVDIPFDGIIDEVAFFNKLLTSEEIEKIHTKSIGLHNYLWEHMGFTVSGINPLLPDQSNNSGKVLSTTGSGVFWSEIDYNSSVVTFLDLVDTPITYSGTEGKYLKTTSSGIEFSDININNGPTNFIDLNDTPTTYSDSEGKFAQSTGSGIEWASPIIFSEEDPVYGTDDYLNSYLISKASNTIFKKNRPVYISDSSYLAKSVVFDIADAHSNTGDYMVVRSVEFYDIDNNIIDIDTIGYTAYATTTFNSSFQPYYAFSTVLSKIGDWTGNSWLSTRPNMTNQRLICVFDSEIIFSSIVINNGHLSGGSTDRGIKTVKIYTSTDTITSTVYNETIPNSNLIFNDVIREHVANDVIDDNKILDAADITIDSGWDKVLETKSNFIDLNDTPTTYSGSEGKYLKTTMSGIEFSDNMSTDSVSLYNVDIHKSASLGQGSIYNFQTAVGYDDYTKLLLHADGVDGSTNFIESVYNYDITVNGDAHISTDQYKFGGSSASFGGTDSQIEFAANDNWTLGGEFTIDLWVYFNTVGSYYGAFIAGQYYSSGWKGWWFGKLNNDKFAFRNNASSIVESTTTAQAGVWYHVAVVRDSSNVVKLYINGVQDGSINTSATILTCDYGVAIGGSVNYGSYPMTDCMNGYVDEVRLSKDIARWTSNFTPPTSAYIADGVRSDLVFVDANNNKAVLNTFNRTGPQLKDIYYIEGKVGIGTQTPEAKLHIDGNIKIGAYTLPSTDGTSNQILKTDGAGNVSWSNIEINTTISGNQDMNYSTLSRPKMEGYIEDKDMNTLASGIINIDVQSANVHEIQMDYDITIDFINVPDYTTTGDVNINQTLIITQSTTASTITWPASVKWPAGVAPELSDDAGEYVLTFMSPNNGSKWYGFLAGGAQLL